MNLLEHVTQDRAIDGINMTDFFTGKEKKSGRDGFIVYMGNEIYGVKWKNWKIHLKEQETAFTEVRTYELPRLYNLLSDPQERDNVILSNSWVPKAAHKLLAEHKRSFAQYPPIKPGTKDPYIRHSAPN